MGARKQKKRSKQASESPRWLAGPSGLWRGIAGPYGSAVITILIAAGATVFAVWATDQGVVLHEQAYNTRISHQPPRPHA